MPTVFERDGFRFFFYSNEHNPIHIHVRYGGGEAVINLENEVELSESYNLKMSELRKAIKLAVENRNLILERWNEHIS